MKRALTFSIIAGSMSCTYDCSICISKMTPTYGIGYQEPKINWKNFNDAKRVASDIYHAETVLITSKGEPTTYPAQITEFLHGLEDVTFIKRELQTNGSLIVRGGLMDQFLRVWYDHGLKTVAVSVYHHDSKKNEEIFRPRTGRYLDLPKLIDKIHENDMEVRLSCVMLKGYIDSLEEAISLMDFARSNGVEQLTFRTADKPDNPRDLAVADFVDQHRIDMDNLGYQEIMKDIVEKGGKPTEILPHGAEVYSIEGMQVCVTSGLSKYQGEENIRSLIFFPNGLLTTSWVDPKGGAILHGWREAHKDA
jgi:molybdenum cofactor biosynthesis enzyme MoaA